MYRKIFIEIAAGYNGEFDLLILSQLSNHVKDKRCFIKIIRALGLNLTEKWIVI